MEIHLNWPAILALGTPLVALAFLSVWLFLRLSSLADFSRHDTLTTAGPILQGKQIEGRNHRAGKSEIRQDSSADLVRRVG